jgi:hypothetical protein
MALPLTFTCVELQKSKLRKEAPILTFLAMRVLDGMRPEIPDNLDGKRRLLIQQCRAADPLARSNFETICQPGIHQLPQGESVEILCLNFPFSEAFPANCITLIYILLGC